jgi:hypothetical protein
MIARIATFVPMTADIEIEARRNLLERFQPALQRQPDLVAAYWLVGEDRRWKSISLWESVEAMERGGAQANATPLLPGQDASKIPSPSRVEIYEVLTHI